jgi:hypothetical protein
MSPPSGPPAFGGCLVSLAVDVDDRVWETDTRSVRSSSVSRQAERVLSYPLGELCEPGFFQAGRLRSEDRERTLEFRLRATREKRSHDIDVTADGRFVRLRDIVCVVGEGESPPGSAPS